MHDYVLIVFHKIKIKINNVYYYLYNQTQPKVCFSKNGKQGKTQTLVTLKMYDYVLFLKKYKIKQCLSKQSTQSKVYFSIKKENKVKLRQKMQDYVLFSEK